MCVKRFIFETVSLCALVGLQLAQADTDTLDITSNAADATLHGIDGTGLHGIDGTGILGIDGTGLRSLTPPAIQGINATTIQGSGGTGVHSVDVASVNGIDGTGIQGIDGTGLHVRGGRLRQIEQRGLREVDSSGLRTQLIVTNTSGLETRVGSHSPYYEVHSSITQKDARNFDIQSTQPFDGRRRNLPEAIAVEEGRRDQLLTDIQEPVTPHSKNNIR